MFNHKKRRLLKFAWLNYGKTNPVSNAAEIVDIFATIDGILCVQNLILDSWRLPIKNYMGDKKILYTYYMADIIERMFWNF